jgi:DNA polymerase-1
MRTLIIDGLNEFIRHYAANPLLSSNGVSVGGIFGFLRALQRFTGEFRPDSIIICFDGEGGSKRKRRAFKGYKEGRKPIKLNRFVEYDSHEEEQNKVWQLCRLTEYLECLPVTQLVYDGVEADDLISYVAQHELLYGWQKVIVSSDKDFIQLLNKKIVLYRPVQKAIISTPTILKEYGIHPNNFCLARSIAGDISDNIKGVGGVGLKTLAKKLPFLGEEKSYYLEDVQRYCAEQIEQKNKAKVFNVIKEEKDRIEKNYSIMQLSVPNFSLNAKVSVNNALKSALPKFKQSSFVTKIMHDQVSLDFSLEELYCWCRRAEQPQK